MLQREKLMTVKGTAIAACFGFGSLLWGSAAYADGWPPNVAGSWSAVANQTSSTPGNLSITQPASSLNCKPISGTIFGDSLQGFYCPTSGRIVFVRKDTKGITIQYYQGNLSQDGTTVRIGGTFSSLNDAYGDYSFYATK